MFILDGPIIGLVKSQMVHLGQEKGMFLLLVLGIRQNLFLILIPIIIMIIILNRFKII